MNHHIKQLIKQLNILLCMCMLVLLTWMCTSKEAKAASAMIEFASTDNEVAAGNTFTVVMTVNASTNIKSVDAYVSYDSAVMTFVEGGKYVSGGSGLLHIVADELSGEKSKVKFSLQFTAEAAGVGTVSISDKAEIKDTDGKKMSTSSNRVTINVSGEGVSTDGSGNSTLSNDAATSNLSNNNSLASLKVSDGTLEPSFNPETTKYKLTIANDVVDVYFSCQTSDVDATFKIKGNENLPEGKKTAKVIVRAPNGELKQYKIKIYKETAEETANRLAGMKEETSNSGIGFDVINENGAVYLKNNYAFQIVDVDESEQVPAGYRKTSVLLYGVNVTAYTIENDLDNDYLLLYCMNEDGDKNFYQFDRQEKSLQRYTGDLIERVNANVGVSNSDDLITSDKYKKNLEQMALIIALLIAVCVMFIVVVLSLMIRLAKAKSNKIDDELDF